MCFTLKKTVPFTQPWTQSDNINNAQATYPKRSHFTCYTFLRSPNNFGQQIYCKIIRCLLATRASIWSRGPIMKRSCVGRVDTSNPTYHSHTLFTKIRSPCYSCPGHRPWAWVIICVGFFFNYFVIFSVIEDQCSRGQWSSKWGRRHFKTSSR